MMTRRTSRGQIALLGLAAAWLGLWGAWVPNAASSLSLNLFYLAEWSTFLPGVRSGEIRLIPEVLRLAASLAGCALLFAVQDIRPAWARWLIRLGAAIPVLFVLVPPYPDVLQMWWSPSYGARFGTASVLGLALIASAFIDRLPAAAYRAVLIAMCALAIGAALAALASLIPPFTADYAAPFGAGWGLAAFMAGLAVAIFAQVGPERVFGPAGEKQNGPVA